MKPPKVLIVEDDTTTRQFFEQLLSRNGYDPIVARDGIEALAALAEKRIDLILSDVGMPRLNGYQLFERVRQQSRDDVRLAIVPFILLTARGMDSDVRYAKSLGVDDCLVKPVSTEDLLAVVRGKLQASRTTLRAYGQQLSDDEATFWINGRLLRVDFARYQVLCDGRQLGLTQRELLVLARLARTPNQVVCPLELIHITHGYEANKIEAGQLLRPLIRDLRRKIKQAFGTAACIQNVRGRGYLLTLA
jgi:two-component system response regulator CpxR